MKKWPLSLALTLLTLVPFFLSAQAIEWRKSYGDFSPRKMIQWGNDRLVLAGQWPDAAGAILLNFNGDSLAAWRGDPTQNVQIEGMTLDTSDLLLIQYRQNPSITTPYRLAVLDSNLNLLMENASIHAYGLETRNDGGVDLITYEYYPITYAGQIISIWPLLPSYSPTVVRDSVWTPGFYVSDWVQKDSTYLFAGSSYFNNDDHQQFVTVWDTFYSFSQSFAKGGIQYIHANADGSYSTLTYESGISNTFSLTRFSSTLGLLSSQAIQDPLGNNFFECHTLVPTDMGHFLTIGTNFIAGTLNRNRFLLELDSLGNRLHFLPLGAHDNVPLPDVLYVGNGIAFISGVAADSSFSLTKVNLLAVGVDDVIENPSGYAYPNPCPGRFSLQLPDTAVQVRVYDAIGRCVLDLAGDNRVFELPEAGIYVWEAELRGGAVVRGKVVW